MSLSPSIIDPQSLVSRITALVLFFLSLIFLIAGLGKYNTAHLSRIRPYDDMGGDANWTELMLLGFLFLSFLTTLFFIIGSKASSKPLHLGYSVGFDLFVSLTLVAIWATCIPFSRFVMVVNHNCRGYSQDSFSCQPGWDVVRGLFVTAYALSIVLALHHGVLFVIATARLDSINRAKKQRQRLHSEKFQGELDYPERVVAEA